MLVEAYLTGILPRSGKALESGSALLKGRESKDNFQSILERETLEIIRLQQNLGFDYIIDGQLFWHDFLRPIAGALQLYPEDSNEDENPVTRQIYTNTFYRKPLIRNKISLTKKIVYEKFFDLMQKGKRKVILPSPFALLYLSDGMHKNADGSINRDAFIELLTNAADILNQEAKSLVEESQVSFVQFNEPCLAYANETKFLWEAIVDSLKSAKKNLNAITSLHLYNGDVSKFLPELLEFPVDRIGIDPYTTNLSKFMGTSINKFLEIGIVNSRNSLVEEPELLAKCCKSIREELNPAGLAIVPNRPLELVPGEIAIKKIESMAKAANILNQNE